MSQHLFDLHLDPCTARTFHPTQQGTAASARRARMRSESNKPLLKPDDEFEGRLI